MTAEVLDNPAPLAVDSHGTLRVGGTRATLDTVVSAFNHGATAESIAQSHPSLDLADVYGVIITTCGTKMWSTPIWSNASARPRRSGNA